MFKRWILLFFVIAGGVQPVAEGWSAKSFAANSAEFLLVLGSGIQRSEWNKQNLKNVFVPMMALSAIEYGLLKNQKVARSIVGDHRDFNTKTTAFLLLATQMLYHVVPALVSGRSMPEGVKSFVQSGQLAVLFFAMSNMYWGALRSVLRAAAVGLFLWQIREVYLVHQEIKKELARLKKSDAVYLQIRPNNQDDVKLPRYLTQNVTSLLRLGFGKLLAYEHANDHFRNEIREKVYDQQRQCAIETFRAFRTPQQPLLSAFKISEQGMDFGLLGMSFTPVWGGFLTAAFLGASIFKIVFDAVKYHARNRKLKKYFGNGSIGNFVCKVCNPLKKKLLEPLDGYLAVFPGSAFLPKNVFDRLSTELQQKIMQLNQQELLFNSTSLFGRANGLFQLFQYSHSLWDEGAGKLDNPQAARKWQLQIIRELINVQPGVVLGGLGDVVEQLSDQQLFNWAEQNPFFSRAADFKLQDLPAIQECKNENPGQAPYNLMEYSLQGFLAFNREYDLQTRQQARALALEVISNYRRKSFIATQTLEATKDLAE
jgi:hypothetical protein